jgi:hypothetical protein
MDWFTMNSNFNSFIVAITEFIIVNEGFFRIYYYRNFDCHIIINSLIDPCFIRIEEKFVMAPDKNFLIKGEPPLTNLNFV